MIYPYLFFYLKSMALNIIWIIWTKGTGKDFFYDLINQKYSLDYNVLRVSFGDQLKKYYIKYNREHIINETVKFLWKDFRLDTEQDFFDSINQLKNIEWSVIRSDLQRLWVEKKKTEWPDFWVRQAYDEINMLIEHTDESKDTFIFITDVRFIDEALYILSTNGILITFKNYKMLRENMEKLSKWDKTISHISEKLWYLPVDLWVTYSLTGDIEQTEFYKFPNQWMLISIMEDIRFLIKNRQWYSSDTYKELLERWNEYFVNIWQVNDKQLTKDISNFVVEINNTFRKDIWIIY